ncbi:protein of unknown function [Xenorhabdus poinarii G6]|uniref:Uncharacterized protein n=1 Tax=Xenorhabdus poinarii G6 TaxID=1354304 RepID=A0A068R5Y7_9GAMM|nr:protein of unknown function [Xenorhabdus poinarii G6]
MTASQEWGWTCWQKKETVLRLKYGIEFIITSLDAILPFSFNSIWHCLCSGHFEKVHRINLHLFVYLFLL